MSKTRVAGRWGDTIRCLLCTQTFPDEKAVTRHLLEYHEWVLGPDGAQPPKKIT